MLVPFHIMILWTDALIYLLVAAVIAFGLWSRRYEHLRAPWRQVVQRRLGMIALVILLVYTVIGLLDSVHFQRADSTRIESVLDVLNTRLSKQYEKTYSAPLAVELYNSTDTEDSRLEHGGSHLSHPNARNIDIVITGIIAVVKAIVLWAGLSCLWIFYLARRSKKTFIKQLALIWKGKPLIAWREILLTLGVISLLGFCASDLAAKYHLFGTTKIGADVFYATIKSIRTGLVIGTLTTLIMLPFALFFGMLAGYLGGWVDDIIQYVYTTLSSIPGVLLIVAGVMSLQIFIANHLSWFPTVAQRADARLLALCLILGITSWTGLCRLLRAETLKLREIDFVAAATALGVKKRQIITRHILPNVMHIVLITVVLDFSMLVLAEAVLAYVGVGVDPTTFSWGNMINTARLELAREPIVWWPLLAAFVFMFVLVLAANIFADAVRDAFDPRLRNVGSQADG